MLVPVVGTKAPSYLEKRSLILSTIYAAAKSTPSTLLSLDELIEELKGAQKNTDTIFGHATIALEPLSGRPDTKDVPVHKPRLAMAGVPWSEGGRDRKSVV